MSYTAKSAFKVLLNSSIANSLTAFMLLLIPDD